MWSLWAQERNLILLATSTKKRPTAKKKIHLTSGSAIIYFVSSKLCCPYVLFLQQKLVDRNTFSNTSIGNWREGWLLLWDSWLSTASLQSDLDSSSWNLMHSESLKCFRFIGKPCTWEHNCGKPSLASFLSLFYLQTNYPIQALHINSRAMIGLIPRNNFEQPSNLIPLGKYLHIVIGFFNWVPNERQVYEIGPKIRIFSYVSYYISVIFWQKALLQVLQSQNILNLITLLQKKDSYLTKFPKYLQFVLSTRDKDQEPIIRTE